MVGVFLIVVVVVVVVVVAAPAEAICGNKIVEKGEQCDCGYADDKSCISDLCCHGRPVNDTQQPGCERRAGKTCR